MYLPSHIRLSSFARSCFANVVSSYGHMIDVIFFSLVRSACLFILKSLRFAVFRSCVLLSCLPTCMYSDLGVLFLMDLPFVKCVLFVDETRLVCLE